MLWYHFHQYGAEARCKEEPLGDCAKDDVMPQLPHHSESRDSLLDLQVPGGAHRQNGGRPGSGGGGTSRPLTHE
jgi:hypothetical protein